MKERGSWANKSCQLHDIHNFWGALDHALQLAKGVSCAVLVCMH